MSVRVTFYSGEGLSSRAIRLLTGADVSHCGVAFGNLEGGETYYEAVGQGVAVSIGGAARAIQSNAARSVEVALPYPELAQRFLERQVGRRYATLELLACWLATFVPERFGLVFYRPATWICSALVAAALEAGGVYCPSDPRVMSPENVRRWIEGGLTPMLRR